MNPLPHLDLARLALDILTIGQQLPLSGAPRAAAEPGAWEQLLAAFKRQPIWHQLEQTVEASPWHREANVATHTEMVIDHYLSTRAKDCPPAARRLTLLAILFHDIGKPAAEEVKYSEARGTYRAYSGHEKLSARAWVDFAMAHRTWPLISELSIDDISTVAFMIEHHLPYGLSGSDKRAALKAALSQRLGDPTCSAFFDLLRADAAGRVADDHQAKLAKVEEWISEFDGVQPSAPPPGASRRAYILSGVSGVGKSTFTRQLNNPIVFSLDDCRLSFYAQPTADPKETYAAAWKHARANEKEFSEYVQRRWKAAMLEAARSHNPLIVDNTNLSRKSRARWVNQLLPSPARTKGESGWHVTGVTFYASLDTVLRRQQLRADKAVPADVVRDMYLRQEEFLVGTECHQLLIINGESQ